MQFVAVTVQIIQIRAQTENIAMKDESLNVLAAIGVKSTLRYAVDSFWLKASWKYNLNALIADKQDILVAFSNERILVLMAGAVVHKGFAILPL